MDAKKEVQSFSIRIEKELHKRFRIQCVKDGVTMNEVIEGLVSQYMHEKEQEQEQS